MWFVYIMRCEDGSLYTGITNDLERRLIEHIQGLGGLYTRSHKVVARVYSEEVPSRSRALQREIIIKKMTKKKKEEMIQSFQESKY